LLQTSAKGRKVVSFYLSTSTLDNHKRSLMLSAIVREFYNKSYCMGNSEAQVIAMKIAELFPGETVDTYFLPSCGKMKARGKLMAKHQNFLTKIRSLKARTNND
jgi:hypothetical protein